MMNKSTNVNDDHHGKEEMLQTEQSIPNNTSLKFGWGKFRPDFLQFLNNSRWFIAITAIYVASQAVYVIGLTALTLPSIEKRFGLTATEAGVIAAANDCSALFVVIFVSFYGDYGNKVQYVAGGGMLIGIGGLLYVLPQLLVGPYQPTHSSLGQGLCNMTSTSALNTSTTQCNMDSDSRWYYMLIFCVAQAIMGVGISPLYSLIPAYLDENVHPKSMPIYLGIFYCATFLGPGIGNAVGGKTLSIYVDIKKPPGLHLKASDPRWIGAWWLGFVIFGILTLIFAPMLSGFPRELPGAKDIREEHIKKGHLRKANNIKKASMKMLLPELKSMLLNGTLFFNILGLAMLVLFGGGVTPFLPKILQLKFGLKPEDSGYAMALIASPAALAGITTGAITVKRFPLKKVCQYTALFLIIVRLLAFVGPLAFIIPGCENVNLAGIYLPYNKTNSGPAKIGIVSEKASKQTLLQASCNEGCPCLLSRFAPVCGSNNITYFDACHAGCVSRLPNKVFANCSCIPSKLNKSGPGTARPGYCDRDCKNLVGFAVLAALSTFLQFSSLIPTNTVTLRCVPENKRAFANGMQYLFLKTFALTPGPILFGHVVDMSCKLWQNTCGKKGRCFVYDVHQVSLGVLVFGLAAVGASAISCFLAWYLYKPEVEEREEGLLDTNEMPVETKL